MSTYAQILYQIVFSTKNRDRLPLSEFFSDKLNIHGCRWRTPATAEDRKDILINYVKNQEEHHRNKTFREEYIALLEEHGVVYDEKYLL